MKNQDQNIALIIKILSEDASLDEKNNFESWIKESQSNQQLYDDTKATWELANSKLDPEVQLINIDDEWSKLESTIGFDENSRESIKNKSRKLGFNWIKIAASIIILIAIGGAWYYLNLQKPTNLVAKENNIEELLPDGSTIALKEQSTLTYSKEFNQESRKVILEGEAFFEVKPDKAKPFIVETGKFNIKVIGTSFLVRNIEKNNAIEVIVSSGKVSVYAINNKSNSIELKAGDKINLDNKNLVMSKSKNFDKNYLSWKTKNFNFDNTTINQVIRTLNHAYNSTIILKNEKLGNCKITVSLENQSLKSVLKVLEATLNIEIKQKGDIIEIIGEGCENIPDK